MNKYAFVVSACSRYTPELTALLNSLEAIGNKHDVFLIAYNLPSEFLEQIQDLSYSVRVHTVTETEAREFGGEGEILCRKRYWYAAEWGRAYDAVCVLDADMVFVRPVDQFFDIAAKCGFIVGAGLEQNRVYGNHPHHKIRGHHLLDPPQWNPKDICCAPMFMDMRQYEGLFKDSWLIFTDGYPDTNFKAPDMESYNILIMIEKLLDKVLLVSNYSFVGTNEKLLKPYTRVVKKQDDLLWTEGGEPIYIVHGQFYKARWRGTQIANRHQCGANYLGHADNSDMLAQGAMNCLYEHFTKMLDYKIKIEKKAYVTGGEPTEQEVSV